LKALVESQVRVDKTLWYPNKEEWLTFSLIILCQKPGMDRNYCLIVFIVYMSYSDHRVLSTCTCVTCHSSVSPWNIFHLRFAIFRQHFWKLELKLRSMILATSAGHFKYWRYGKTREFRVKTCGICWRKI
jgi:hypothetical protein